MKFSQSSRSGSTHTTKKPIHYSQKSPVKKCDKSSVSVINLQSVKQIVDSSIDIYHEDRNKIFNKISYGDIRASSGDGIRIKSGSLILLPEFEKDGSEIFVSNESDKEIIIEDKSGTIMGLPSFTVPSGQTILLVKDGANWITKIWASDSGPSEFMVFPEAP